MPQIFRVHGGSTLNGDISVGGSKNAALPLLCATLLTKDPVTLHNLPDIQDIRYTLNILEHLGSKITKIGNHSWTIDNAHIQSHTINTDLASKFRGSLIFMGSLLSRFRETILPYPGGCVIGKRPIDSHLFVAKKMGAKITENETGLRFTVKKLKGTTLIMPEVSVTATENAILLAVMAEGTTELRMVAQEPHVVDLCELLTKMGADIQGAGTHTIIIRGVKKLHGAEHSITPDYLEAAALITAGIITRGEVTVENFIPRQLDAMFVKLDEIGIKYKRYDDRVTVYPTKIFHAPSRIEARPHPGFPTDILAPFATILTQCHGMTKVFETLFEGRLGFLFELEKMGAKVEILNPHQALVIGPTKLKGTSVSSLDLRAGATMVLAGLIAQGTTEVNNIHYIDRGYEKLEEKLNSLGAKIERVTS